MLARSFSVRRGLLTACAVAALIVGSFPLPAHAVSWTDLAKDTFTRTATGSWGSAESGGSWTSTVDGSASVSVAGGQGLVSGLDSGDRVVSAIPIVATDSHVTSKVTFSGPTSADVFYGWRLRQSTDGKSYYALTYRSNPTGSITLSLSRVINGTSTWISGVKVAPQLQSGTQHTLEAELVGTAVNARIWQTGSTTPAWQLTASDSSSSALTSGRFAVDSYVNATSGSVTLKQDDILLQGSGGTAATPTPTPTPTPSSGRGTSLGSQSYSIPAGSVFVDATNGNDNNAGALATPLKTVAKALTKVTAGGTIVLRAGTYHESISIEKKVTIQNYPNEVAWFDGSKSVTGWTKSGSAWVASGWTASFSNTMGGDSTFYNRFLLAAYPMARYPDQVFVNGAQLQQVASASAVSAGEFYVDYATDKLYVGTDPSGKDVRASDLAQAIKVNSSGVTLQGFGVRRYATPYETRGTIGTDFSGGVFRHLVVTDNATIGMALSGADKVIDHVQVERNGMLGIGSNVAHRLKLTNSVVSHNDSEHFKFAPVSGGVKITSATDIVVSNNDVSANNEGMGIWLDAYNKNFTIVNNVATDNGQVQIEVEISSGGIVANNVATGGESGINVYDTDNVKVFNNHLGGSTLFGIKLAQDARWKTIAKSGFALLTKNVLVANNVFGCGKTFQFYARDGETNISADKMAITIQGNLFSKRVDTSKPTMVGWGLGDNVNITRYESPAALAAAKGSSWDNGQTSGCEPLADMSAEIAANQSVAYPLPSDVASAVGKPTNFLKVGRI